MFPATSYISLGIAPDAAGIVVQPMVLDNDHHRPFFSFVIALADIAGRGAAGAIDFMGCVLLHGLSAYFPVIHIYAESLIPDRPVPLTIRLPDHSGNKREPHMRIYAVNAERSIILRRFDGEQALGQDAPAIVLAPLMAIGPAAVASGLGAALLAELRALHPHVFAPFPALLADAVIAPGR
jgi:hypothetical protein